MSGVCHLIAERVHLTHRGVCLEVVNTESLPEALYNKSSLEAVDKPFLVGLDLEDKTAVDRLDSRR